MTRAIIYLTVAFAAGAAGWVLDLQRGYVQL